MRRNSCEREESFSGSVWVRRASLILPSRGEWLTATVRSLTSSFLMTSLPVSRACEEMLA